jgi:hypothetical protein
MNHYVKMAGAVCAGILGAKFVEASVKTVAGVLTKAAVKVASMNKAEDAPSAETPKPKKPGKEDKKTPEKKDDKKPGKEDKKTPETTDDKKPAAEAE